MSADGGFAESLTADLRGSGANLRCRVQARQIYAYAVTGKRGLYPDWSQPVVKGLDYLFTRLRRPDGLYRTLIGSTGQPIDEATYIYDQAFVLLALSAATAAGVPGLEREARDLLAAMAPRRLAQGGFLEAGSSPYQANAHMHLLEAALDWCETSPSPVWSTLANEVIDLALQHFVLQDAVVEHFDENWTVRHDANNHVIVEPGHQYEWAWLLQRAAAMLPRPDLRSLPHRLYRTGVRGVDDQGYTVDGMSLFSFHRHASARLWPQAERLKAATVLSRHDENQGCDCPGLLEAFDKLRGYLREDGSWRDDRPDGRSREECSPASSLYHIVCAAEVLLGSVRPI